MGLFESLMGGGQRGVGARPPEQMQQQQDFQDFISRYEQGPPSEGYSDQEVMSRYQQVAPHISPEVYQQSAQEAFARMSPQERAQFGQYLQQQARTQNVNFPDLNRDGVDDRLQDPAYLAQVTSRMHQQQPGLLGQLLGGASGGSSGGASNEAVLQAIQIRNAYEADKNTPTDQWLRARGMSKAQLDAALALAARADPQGRGFGGGAGAGMGGGMGAGGGVDMAGMLGNPLAKAALAGIAAMAAKRMLSGR